MIPEWFRHASLYEIYPQSFNDTNGDGIGDIPGIIEKLDYIQSLGFNAIWINPCFDSPMQDAGYDVRDYRKVDKRYGTNEDLVRLFALAHKKGMHVLLDLVPGHTSVEHEWFQMSQKAERNEYSDRYIWTEFIFDKPKGYYWLSGSTERNGNALVNFFDCQPAINYGFAEKTYSWQMKWDDPRCLKNFDAIIDIMRFWLSKGCDGFRVDMAMSLVKDDPSGEATGMLWQRAQTMLRKEFPEAVLISEWSEAPKALNLAGFQGDMYLGFSGVGYHSLMRAGEKSYFRKEGLGDLNVFLQEYLFRYQVTRHAGFICFVTGNHDEYRAARNLSMDELKICYAFLLTMPGAPILYAGDEIGMRYLDLLNKEGGYHRTGSRTPIQWNHEKNYGFSTADKEKIYLPQDESGNAPTVIDQENDPDSLLQTVRRLLVLRREYDDDLCGDADFETVYLGERGYPFVYRRGGLKIAMNPCAEARTIPLEVEKVKFVLGSFEKGCGECKLSGQSFIVW